jgi:hypothetical protein
MARGFFTSMLAVTLLAACATPKPPPVAVIPLPEPRETPAVEEPELEPRHDTLKHLANRTLKPIETRPLNAKAKCSFRDQTGYRGRLQLDVKAATVKHFEARVDVPKQGSCAFKLADFTQTDSDPNVVLSSRQGNCKVSLWEQGNQVTVAFRDCRSECSGGAFEYLWPILVDNRKGRCS